MNLNSNIVCSRFRAVVAVSLLLLCGCANVRQPELADRNRTKELIEQGRYYLRSGDLDKASAAFEVALEIAPAAAAFDGLGCVALLRGHYSEAERYLWKAYESDESYNHSLGNLALLYEARGEVSQAGSMYEWALQADPKNFRVRNNYAVYLAEHTGEKSLPTDRVKRELLKAHALAEHPVIEDNLKSIDEVTWQAK